MFGVACDRRAVFCQPKTRGLLFFNGEPCILLDGTNRTHAGIVADNALDAIGESIAIKGLAFEDFNNTVQLTGGTNHVLQGNQFGGSIGFSSTILASNDIPILLASDGASIGGLAASHANLSTADRDRHRNVRQARTGRPGQAPKRKTGPEACGCPTSGSRILHVPDCPAPAPGIDPRAAPAGRRNCTLTPVSGTLTPVSLYPDNRSGRSFKTIRVRHRRPACRCPPPQEIDLRKAEIRS